MTPYQKAAEELLARTVRESGLQITDADQRRMAQLFDELSKLPEMVWANDVRYQELSKLVYRATVYGHAEAKPRMFDGLMPRYNKD